jgi:hypothetical protein
MKIMVDWVNDQKIPGLKLEVVTEKGRTPLIFIEVEGEGKTEDTVLLYGACALLQQAHRVTN